MLPDGVCSNGPGLVSLSARALLGGWIASALNVCSRELDGDGGAVSMKAIMDAIASCKDHTFGQMLLDLGEARGGLRHADGVLQRLDAAAEEGGGATAAHRESTLAVRQFIQSAKEEVDGLTERLNALIQRYPVLLQRCMQKLPKQLEDLVAKAHPKVFFQAIIPVFNELVMAERSEYALSECKKALKHNM